MPGFLGALALNTPSSLAGENPTYIVTLRPGVEADGENVAKEMKLKTKCTYRHALRGFAAPLDDRQVKKLRKDKRVLAVERDGRVQLCEQTIPTGVARMGVTNFPLARINGLDERIDVDVAVLDTGIQTNHPDLNVYRVVSFTDSDGNDQNGHGTQIGGIVGALDNDFGVVGVAPGVRLWAVQHYAFPGEWEGTLAGLDYIAQHADEIEIVNCSFVNRARAPYEAIRQAFSNVVSLGVVVIAAVGNNGVNIAGGDGVYGTFDDILPAALSEIMAVSSMDPITDSVAWNSNFSWSNKVPSYVNSPGAGIDVGAPGVNILTTDLGSSYGTHSGTSFAAPHICGLVALYIAANGRAHNAQEVYQIRQRLVDFGQPQSQWAVTNSDPDLHPEPLAVTSEAWIAQPRILSQSITPPDFQFSFTTVPGYLYTPQFTDSLSASNQWIDLIATNGTGTNIIVSDPVLNAIRYYRVKRERTP